MTYIFLKVTELLALNNPNVHARYKPDKNSLAYLKRVCDVNYITGATPCIHGDDAVITALAAHGWNMEDIRDWVVNGCVEPGIPGKHCSATSSIEFNLVAPLEMALNNGKHPLMNWKLGPETGIIEMTISGRSTISGKRLKDSVSFCSSNPSSAIINWGPSINSISPRRFFPA